MKRTKEDAEQTRLNLLVAAERVFGRQGFAATRLSDIATEANVTRGAIYHHFGNKMDLFIALHKERVDPYFQKLDEIFASDLLPKDKIRKVFIDFLSRAREDASFVARQRFDLFRDVEFCSTKELHDFIKERGEKVYYKFVELIKYGQKIQNIRDDIDPELSALIIMAFMKGLVSIYFMESEEKIINNNSNELIDTLFKGF